MTRREQSGQWLIFHIGRPESLLLPHHSCAQAASSPAHLPLAELLTMEYIEFHY